MPRGISRSVIADPVPRSSRFKPTEGEQTYDFKLKKVKKRSEGSVAATLNWLYRHQAKSGKWSLGEFNKQCKGDACSGRGKVQSDTAATAAALLAFLAAGQTPERKGPYQQSVTKGFDWLIQQQAKGDLPGKRDRSKAVTTGIDWLIKNQQGSNRDVLSTIGDRSTAATALDLLVAQKAKGNLSGTSDRPMHAHAIAAVALCSAFGMTKDPKIGAAAQEAIDFIERTQDASTGGWRHSPKDAGDIVEFGWQIMALKSAQCAGLKVTPGVLENAKKWLR